VTNPANAVAGTIRKGLAKSIEANSVHGSDSNANGTELVISSNPKTSSADSRPRMLVSGDKAERRLVVESGIAAFEER